MASTPVSRATPVPERDDQLLQVGAQCAEDTCNTIDFLPFKCQHCKKSFCQEHYKVEAHRCPEYDEAKHDRVAPNCPLCNTPVAIPPGQDPNLRMDAHLTNECSVMTGRVKAKSSPVCAKGNCKKVLFAPIKCTQCREQFCPSHRFPSDHNCAAPAPTPAGSGNSKTAASRLLNEFNNKASGSSVKKTVSSASASVSKSIASAKASAAALNISKANSTGTVPSNKTPGNNPFSKVDRALPTLPSTANSNIIIITSADANNINSNNLANNAETNANTKPKPPVMTFKRSSFLPPPVFAFG